MVNKSIICTRIANIEKSIAKLIEKSRIKADVFKSDSDLQDIVIHNLQLAIQGSIDIASHILSDEGWEVPGTTVGLFEVLLKHKVIDSKTTDIMRNMAGFRNLLVHEYDTIDIGKEKKIGKMEEISLAPLLAKVIKRIHEGKSLGALFKWEEKQMAL